MAIAARIAILGWGSLLWDLETLAPHVTGGWQHRHGPRLPMEFSRISPKRKMGLVLCLDPEAGAACATHAIRSARPALQDTIADLARRERTALAAARPPYGCVNGYSRSYNSNCLRFHTAPSRNTG